MIGGRGGGADVKLAESSGLISNMHKKRLHSSKFDSLRKYQSLKELESKSCV